MAKRAEKKTLSTPKKKASQTKSGRSSKITIEKACEIALEKLRAMKIEIHLQADIEWCLGSYRYDKNPSGLFEMAQKALQVFKSAAERNTKSVSKKLINDIEKAIANKN